LRGDNLERQFLEIQLAIIHKADMLLQRVEVTGANDEPRLFYSIIDFDQITDSSRIERPSIARAYHFVFSCRNGVSPGCKSIRCKRRLPVRRFRLRLPASLRNRAADSPLKLPHHRLLPIGDSHSLMCSKAMRSTAYLIFVLGTRILGGSCSRKELTRGNSRRIKKNLRPEYYGDHNRSGGAHPLHLVRRSHEAPDTSPDPERQRVRFALGCDSA
jgi:hypothetical protein